MGASGRAKVATQIASVAVVNADGRVLFGKRRDNGRWTLPGGHLEPGEAPIVGAARELAEETGIVVPTSRLVPLGKGRVGDYEIHAFRLDLDDASQTGKLGNDPDDEMSELRWASRDDAEILGNLHSPRNVTLRLMGWPVGEPDDMTPAQRAAEWTIRGAVAHAEYPLVESGAWDADAATRRARVWASLTTCALVRINPSSPMMNPEPWPRNGCASGRPRQPGRPRKKRCIGSMSRVRLDKKTIGAIKVERDFYRFDERAAAIVIMPGRSAEITVNVKVNGDQRSTEQVSLNKRGAADVKDMQRHVQTFLSRVRLTDHVVFVVDKDKLPAFSGLSSTNVHFVANGEKLGLVRLAEITSQTIRPGIDAWRRVRISASGRLPFALDTLESLQRLENDLPEGTVTCYLIAEILGNVAIRVSLKDLIEFIRFRDHLIAIQA
jgi:8-oxo-dGTP pyrophosphatase MutT (NUDIX family)